MQSDAIVCKIASAVAQSAMLECGSTKVADPMQSVFYCSMSTLALASPHAKS